MSRASGERPLRIGIITDGIKERPGPQPAIANGGVGVYIAELVRHLLEIDERNRYFLLRCGEGRLDLYRRDPARCSFIPATAWHRIARWTDLPYSRVARELRLDLVHQPNQCGALLLPSAVRRILTVHDLSPLLLPRMHRRRTVWRFRTLLGPSLRQADRIITCSQHTRTALLSLYRLPGTRVAPIALGVSASFRPALRTASFAQRYPDLPERYIVCVAVFEPRKNHVLLLESLRRLHRCGERIAMVWVGRRGWRWANPLDEPRFHELRPWVHIYEDVPADDLAELYACAQAAAYPSLYEGFGMPLLEAMACGIPVVSSDRGSLPEVAARAALYSDPEDPEQFAAQLQRVLRDAPLRAALVSAGLERARQFSWARTAADTLAVYRSAIAQPPAQRPRRWSALRAAPLD